MAHSHCGSHAVQAHMTLDEEYMSMALERARRAYDLGEIPSVQ